MRKGSGRFEWLEDFGNGNFVVIIAAGGSGCHRNFGRRRNTSARIHNPS